MDVKIPENKGFPLKTKIFKIDFSKKIFLVKILTSYRGFWRAFNHQNWKKFSNFSRSRKSLSR
jgi:hypothetical protein